ncbi:MAG: DUF2892 domain-containing protein [Parachlamydia sp.]|jgi:hypothetical protein|nr:DUF2892 domain-containing protein [Parachlamydia sp.]
MKKNIGLNDRFIRLSIAIFLLLIAVYQTSWVFFFAGLFVLFEATFSWCLFYQMIGKNSCPNPRKK